ncbi:MAG: hypothetical protein J6Y03_03400 [Alphaproteobacteria bacterium]|nr:hypothetical protein [Alphaproteobacteria bacterium]
MSFSLFALFFVATLLLCLTFLYIGKHERNEKGLDTSNKAGLAVTASIVFGWVLLQFASKESVFPFEDLFGLAPFLVAAAALSMYVIRKEKINRFWIYLFVTATSVTFIPEDILIFQGLVPLFYDRFATAFLWALFISIYTRMDKLNGMTIFQTNALCLGFALFPLITAARKLYPTDFCFYPMIILSALIGFINYKKHEPDASLGRTGSAPLGYLMGLFFILLAIKGFWMAFLVMPFYYYFETIYSLINKLIHRNAPMPTSSSFFVSWITEKYQNIRGLFSFLFLVMMGFAAIGLLFNENIQLLLTLTFFLLIYALYKLFYWGRPKITYRSMFKDTKDLFVLLKSNVKDSCETVSTYIKDKNKK